MGRATNLPPLEDRFRQRLIKSDGCWGWTGATSPSTGYSVFVTGHSSRTYAHRFSYELFKGPIPNGYQIDHLCRNRPCVNPDHLEAVTQQENIRRARSGFCIRGHDLSDPTHLYIRPDNGKNMCRTCSAIRSRARKAA